MDFVTNVKFQYSDTHTHKYYNYTNTQYKIIQMLVLPVYVFPEQQR